LSRTEPAEPGTIAQGLERHLELQVSGSADPRDVAILEEAVHQETMRRASVGEATELAVFLRDAGKVCAGVYGFTWGGTYEVQYLWVEPALRGRGEGTRLLHLAEREAACRGCGLVVVFTHALQSGHFYERCGYQLVGRVDGYPAGDAALWYAKRL
jgi:N-acetylglutamate synthase-like GNAT family acetyltransferase